MDHFDKRCVERVGSLVDRPDIKNRICSGEFRILSVDGAKYHVEVPIANDRYNVIYDYEKDALVTIWKLECNCVIQPRRNGKKGKRRQTVPKKLVPLRSFGRMN